MKQAIATELEKEHNVYIDAELEIYTTGERDDETGWMPIPDSWVDSTNVVEKDYDVEQGFAWIVLDDGSSIQACLTGDYPRHNIEIDLEDSGMAWGMCGDINHDAFETYSKDECIKIFVEAMESIGVKVINKKV